MAEIEELVGNGHDVTEAVEIVAEAFNRSVSSVQSYYYRHRSAASKVDSHRSLCILTKDEEKILMDFLYAMSSLDFSSYCVQID